MPYYMVQAAYTRNGWEDQKANPRDVMDRVRPLAEQLGGRLESMFYTFGEYDILAIIELPGNVNAAAFSLTASASAKAIKTTPLMTIEEGMEAMRTAGGIAGYAPPGG